jgi:hypothetical protein
MINTLKHLLLFIILTHLHNNIQINTLREARGVRGGVFKKGSEESKILFFHFLVLAKKKYPPLAPLAPLR